MIGQLHPHRRRQAVPVLVVVVAAVRIAVPLQVSRHHLRHIRQGTTHEQQIAIAGAVGPTRRTLNVDDQNNVIRIAVVDMQEEGVDRIRIRLEAIANRITNADRDKSSSSRRKSLYLRGYIHSSGNPYEFLIPLELWQYNYETLITDPKLCRIINDSSFMLF